MTPHTIKKSALSSLKIHQNPLFIRSLKVRLRRRSMLGVGAVILTISAWLFSITFFGTSNISEFGQREAARAAFVPLFIFQGLILIFLGTGSVAHGIASDKERGVLDYQRLTPMAPRDKILGDLFGYPAREYFMFLLTTPFIIFLSIVGQISFWGLLQLYIVFFSSVTVYHMTGLVVALYLVLPQIARFGFGIFGYLTIFPTLNMLASQELSGIVEGVSGGAFTNSGQAPFFGLALPPFFFTLILQGGLLWLFSNIMLRKWRHDVNPALSRRGIVIAASLVHVLAVGSLWSSMLHPEEVLSRLFFADSGAQASEQLLDHFAGQFLGGALLIYFALAGILGVLWLHIATPDGDGLREGMRRARKAQKKRLGPWRDRAPSLWLVFVLTFISAIGYLVLLTLSTTNPVFTRFSPNLLGSITPILVLLGHLLIVQGAQTTRGNSGLFMVLFFLWVVPLLLMILAMAVSSGSEFSAYLATPSPLAGIFFTVYALFDDQSLGGNKVALSFISVFWAVAFASLMLWNQRQQMKKITTRV